MLNFRNADHAAFDHASLKLKRRNILGDLGQRFGQGYRIGLRVRDGVGAGQILKQSFGGRSRSRALGQRILDDFILAADGLHRAAQFGVVFHANALKSR